MKLFFGEIAQAGVKPVASREHEATGCGALGDHGSSTR